MKLLIAIILSFIFFLPIGRSQDTLKVTTWNVFLRPAIMADQQMKRVDSISAWLQQSNSDILVLQEVFHRRARKKLIASLEGTFPYHFGPGKGGLIKTNSGVMIFCRDTITNTVIKRFRYATGSDQLAYKSGVSGEIEFKDKRVQIVGTHLQAGDGDKRHKIRMSQQKTLQSMLKDNSDSSYVQILAGDFNTKRSSYYYGQMLEILDSKTVDPSSDLRYSANNSKNPLFKTNGKPELIDFVLLQQQSKAKISQIQIVSPQALWSQKTKFLSDHNAIIATFIIEQ